jgi:hypothetical protein
MNYATYVEKNFKGRKIPEDLDRLLRLSADNNLRRLSYELEYAGIKFRFVEDSDEWLTHWLGYESQIINHVLGIATNGAGDLLAFWLYYDEWDLTDAPIVFFGHEGIFSVLANNFKELLPLLASCGNLHPYAIEDYLDELDCKDEEIIHVLAMEASGEYAPGTLQQMKIIDEETAKRKAEFVARLGIEVAQNPAEVMRRAIALNPNFEDWINHRISAENPEEFDS